MPLCAKKQRTIKSVRLRRLDRHSMEGNGVWDKLLGLALQVGVNERI